MKQENRHNSRKRGCSNGKGIPTEEINSGGRADNGGIEKWRTGERAQRTEWRNSAGSYAGNTNYHVAISSSFRHSVCRWTTPSGVSCRFSMSSASSSV